MQFRFVGVSGYGADNPYTCLHPQTIDVGCRNENVLTEPFQPTIMEGKGSEDMSFVGIVFAEGKIIGFGDSKATILQNGIMRQDILRQNVRKVFSNGRIIIACCGANEIPVMEERKLKYIRVEDWMREHINEYSDPSDLCRGLYAYARDFQENRLLDPIQILAGARKDFGGKKETIFLEAQICKDELTLTEKIVHGAYAFYSGAREYRTYFEKMRRDCLVTADKEYLQAVLEKSVLIHEGELPYNPVGLPFYIEEI